MSRLGAKQKRALAAVPAEKKSSDFVRQSPTPKISRWSNSIGYAELFWNQIQSILQNAERGYTEQWGDLTRRMLKTNAHLFSLYETRNNSIASARREVTPRAVPEQYAMHAQRAAEDCEKLLSNLPNIERTIAQLLDADWTGYATQEIMWVPRGDMVVCDALVWIHPREIRFANDFTPYIWANGMGAERARELGIEADSSNGMLGLPLTRNKYLVHMPQTVPDYATSNGILLSCVRPWFVSSWVTQFALSGAEASGNPRTLGHLPEEAPQAVQDAMFEALSGLSADGVGVVRGESTIEILDAKMSSDGGVWETLLKRQDAAMSKAALGSTLNVEIGDTGGAYAAAESQADITITPRWAKSAASVANTIESQLFRPFLEFNRHRYGGMVFVPQLTMHIVEAEPTVDDTAINAGVVTVDELRRSRKLEPLGPERGGDALIKPAAPAAAFSVSAGEAPAAAPLARPRALSSAPGTRSSRPWTLAEKMSAGSAATLTSGHSPTMPSEPKQ